MALIFLLYNGKKFAEARDEYGNTVPSSYAKITVLTFEEPASVYGIVTPMLSRYQVPMQNFFSALELAKLFLAAGIPSAVIHTVLNKNMGASMELAYNLIGKKLGLTGSTAAGNIT
ncbi:hypothetical protein LZ31DRAFT_595392 [Colletotrichum somersetense]|nr:hypothetical protein LZ31DRAFT_595392 [Colletotrichum somersetense]